MSNKIRISLLVIVIAVVDAWTSTAYGSRSLTPYNKKTALSALFKNDLEVLHQDYIDDIKSKLFEYEYADEKHHPYGSYGRLLQKTSIESESETTEEDKNNNVNVARALILCAATLYGSNFPLVKMMGESTSLPVGLTCTIRFGLAALATSPWLFSGMSFSKSDWSETPESQAIVAGFEVGCWNSIAYMAQAVGLETTLASKSAFFCSLAVVVVPLLDLVFKKKIMTRNQISGLVLAMAGVAALELGDTDLSMGPLFSHGDLISLIQPLAFGMAFWRMETAMHKIPGNHALRATASQLSAVFLSSALFATIFERGNIDISQLQALVTDPMAQLSLLWTGLVTTALTIYMESAAMKTLSAAETTVLLSTEPISGALFAAALMNERLGPWAIIGSFMILTSCMLSSFSPSTITDFFRKQLQSKHS